MPSSRFSGRRGQLRSLLPTRTPHHLTILQQVVEDREYTPLTPLNPVEDEDAPSLDGTNRRRVDVLELPSRANLPALLELALSNVAVEANDLERLVLRVNLAVSSPPFPPTLCRQLTTMEQYVSASLRA